MSDTALFYGYFIRTLKFIEELGFYLFDAPFQQFFQLKASH